MQVNLNYPDKKCPDCQEPIPDHCTEGDSCHNCEHVFTESKPCDDELPQKPFQGFDKIQVMPFNEIEVNQYFSFRNNSILSGLCQKLSDNKYIHLGGLYQEEVHQMIFPNSLMTVYPTITEKTNTNNPTPTDFTSPKEGSAH